MSSALQRKRSFYDPEDRYSSSSDDNSVGGGGGEGKADVFGLKKEESCYDSGNGFSSSSDDNNSVIHSESEIGNNSSWGSDFDDDDDDDDDDSDGRNEVSRRRRRLLYHYEQLGAPTILYRHRHRHPRILQHRNPQGGKRYAAKQKLIDEEEKNIAAMEYIPPVDTYYNLKPWNTYHDPDAKRRRRFADHTTPSEDTHANVEAEEEAGNAITGNNGLPEAKKAASSKDVAMSAKELDEEKDKRLEIEKRYDIQDNPFSFGNCLQLIPCSCCACSAKSNKLSLKNNFLIYPKGQSLCISLIRFPHPLHEEYVHPDYAFPIQERKDVQVDVGGRVLQVETSIDPSDTTNNIPSETFSVVRTPKDFVMVACQKSVEQYAIYCTGAYKLEKIKTLNITSASDDRGGGESLEPVFVAANKHNPSSAFNGRRPTFATLSKRQDEMVLGEVGPTVIHHITCDVVDAKPNLNMKRHEIENVASISQIHFSPMHPMVLWSAARSKSEHKLILGVGYHTRPTIGYGHSLHSIDLRSNQASFVWSPSHDEYVCKGIHSVDSILTDNRNPYSIYVSSSSAGGKVYHVDARMPARTICSWALPGMCNEDPDPMLCNSPSGIYKCGMHLTRPQIHGCYSALKNIDLPVLGATKTPKSFGFHLYQAPEKRGYFHTKNLERVANQGLDPTRNMVTSTYVPHPFASDNTFTTGIAAFYVPTSSILKDVGLLGYDEKPDLSLCVITATSRGHLFSTTMLACPEGQEAKAEMVNGGPLGACAVPLPTMNANKRMPQDKRSHSKLPWTLSNIYPSLSDDFIARNTIIPSHQYSRVPPEKTYSENIWIAEQPLIGLPHPRPHKYIGRASMKPPTVRPIITYKVEIPEGNRYPGKRRYPVKRPSENIRAIISKLRERPV